MPSINSIKLYLPDAFYHVYIRGNNKKLLFHNENDYLSFMQLLKDYVTPPLSAETAYRKNYSTKIEILAYCLMPNHYHMLLLQTAEGNRNIVNFMQSLNTAYALYLNKKYKQTGSPFESSYKARLITNINDFLVVTRYIHRNSLDLGKDMKKYEYSSYQLYLLGDKFNYFINRTYILAAFNYNLESFRRFHLGLT